MPEPGGSSFHGFGGVAVPCVGVGLVYVVKDDDGLHHSDPTKALQEDALLVHVVK